VAVVNGKRPFSGIYSLPTIVSCGSVYVWQTGLVCQADTVVASVSHPETICLNYGRGVAPLFPQQASLDSEKSGIEVAWFGSGPMSSF